MPAEPLPPMKLPEHLRGRPKPPAGPRRPYRRRPETDARPGDDCPECGGRLAVRSSYRVGARLRRRRLVCGSCGAVAGYYHARTG